jgi:hypothetical protein
VNPHQGEWLGLLEPLLDLNAPRLQQRIRSVSPVMVGIGAEA